MPGLLLVLLAERFIAPVSQMSGDVQAASCQGHLFIAWQDSTGVAAAVDGRVVNVSTTTRGTPAVACGRDSWLVAWPSQDFGVDGRRVRFDGTLLAPITIFRGPFGASDVAAAYGEGAFLVAWSDGVTIRATRVSDGGAVVDPSPVAVAPVGFFIAPRIVWTGTAFFVAWAEKSLNPFNGNPVRLWGTRVVNGIADPVLLPRIAFGTGAARFSVTAAGDRITYAWVAEHGQQTCVDVAELNAAPRQIRCSGDAAGSGIPVLDQAQILASRGELLLVWREIMPDVPPDVSSVLRAMRVDVDLPPYAILSQNGFGAGLTATADGVAAVYFAGFPVGVYMRVIEQDKPPARRHAVGH